MIVLKRRMPQVLTALWLFSNAWIVGGCTRRHEIPKDTLVVAISAQPLTLDPRFATDATGMRICDLIFSSLVRLGPKLEPIGDAAESWTYRDHVFTFRLRPDLHFHNGRAVNADDIRFSFDQFLKQKGPFATTLDIIEDVKVVEEGKHLVVRIRLRNFSDKFLKSDLPAVKILPQAETLAAGRDFSKQLIGSGGFRFVNQTSDAIELEGVRAASRHLIFKTIRDDFTRYQKMLKGDIDIAQMEIGPDKVREFEKYPDRFQVFLYPGLSMTYVLINMRDPLLAQKPVREALATAIRRDELIRYKMYGHALEATSILTPNNPYFMRGLKNPPYDPILARKQIEALGFAGRSLVLKTSNTPQAVDNGKVLAYQLKQTGLDVQVQSYEWGTFYADVKKGGFQLAIMRWVGTVDPDIYRLAFHSREKPPGRNRGSYVNPDLDRLLDLGTREEDLEKRKKIFFEVQKTVQEDIAIIPLWYDEQIAVAKREVIDYQPNQTGDFWPLLEAHKK